MNMSNFFRIPILMIFLLSISMVHAQKKELDPSILKGKWILDTTPHIEDDSKFASMEITKVTGDTLEGYFYRAGVNITEGQINLSTGKMYGALVSGDGTGKYYTSFYYENEPLNVEGFHIERLGYLSEVCLCYHYLFLFPFL